jgi:gas vesicle protein
MVNMKKIGTWFIGTVLGGIVGLLSMLFFSGEDFREAWREHYQAAMAEGRRASAIKRAELETELQMMKHDNAANT